jgi:protein farnesyltransferase/geranylgeranyltransferase type-1 subunit alpha
MAIKWPLEDERELMDELAVKHLKNYQVWHHRRLLLAALQKAAPDPSALRKAIEHELTFIANGLRADTKNYHTWSYRQWILTQTDDPQVWKGELPWIESLLEEDVRNNSAWHHRFFVVWQSGVRSGDEDREEVTRREIRSVVFQVVGYHSWWLILYRFAKNKLSLAPNNPSAWNYLRGVLDHTNTPYAEMATFIKPYAERREPGPVGTTDEEDIDLDNPLPSELAELPAPAAIEFLAEILERGNENERRKAVEVNYI